MYALTECLCLEGTGDLKAVQDYLDANPHQLDNRTLFQSNLLHIAARNGQTATAEELLKRGIDLDALDYVRCTSSWALHIRFMSRQLQMTSTSEAAAAHSACLCVVHPLV